MDLFKVVHITWGLTYGGIETMLVNIANAQVQEGAKVHVIIVNDYYEKDLLKRFSPDVTVHLLHRSVGSYNPLFIVKLNLLLHRLKPNAIHMHASSFITALWGKNLSRVACATLHALPQGVVRRDSLISRLCPIKDITMNSNVAFMDKVPHIYAISQAVKDELKDKYDLDSRVVENGILVNNFARRQTHTPSSPIRIVQVSRLIHDKKGQDLLIRAVAKSNSNFTVDFIGDGPSLDYLKQLSMDLGVSDRIHFLGLQSQNYIAEHLCEYDLFVQPSRYEGFGLTVAEAMAAQVPVLVSSGQGPEEVICGNKYGWVFENGDEDDLRHKLEHISNHYGEALNKCLDGYKYVLGRYDVSVTAKLYLSEYKTFE